MENKVENQKLPEITRETFSIPSEVQEQVRNLINNGVFKDLQNLTDTAIICFLNNFYHAKIDPKKTQPSICKFRVLCESMDDLINFLQENEVKGHYNIVLVDYKRYHLGDFLMYHVKTGTPLMVFEVDIYESNSNLKDGAEYVFN